MSEWESRADSGGYINYVSGQYDLYFQPGGCLEIGCTDDEDVREFLHFCPSDVGLLESAVEMWRAHPNGPKS